MRVEKFHLFKRRLKDRCDVRLLEGAWIRLLHRT